MPREKFDPLAGMRPRWLVKPIVWVAGKMTGPLFVVEFVLFLIAWGLINTIGPMYIQVDKWPFMGLNLFMSALAGIQAAVIGVKQTISENKRDWIEERRQKRMDKVLLHVEDMDERIIAKLEEREQKKHVKHRDTLQS